LSKDQTRTDRVFKALPGIGALGGAAWGAANPHVFKPDALFSGLKHKLRTPQGRLASGMLGAATMAGVLWAPSTVRDMVHAVRPPPTQQPRSIPLYINKEAQLKSLTYLAFADELEKLSAGGSKLLAMRLKRVASNGSKFVDPKKAAKTYGFDPSRKIVRETGAWSGSKSVKNLK